MVQMYKVFVENRPIIICEKNQTYFDCKTLFASSIKSIREDLFPLFVDQPLKMPIVLLSDDARADFKRLFADHKLIEAAGGIVRRKKRYLFIKRFGKWDIPKGKLDKNEDPKLGAIREIEEECGIINPKIDCLICHTYHTYLDTYKGKNKLVLKKTYWYELNYKGTKDLFPQREEGITKAKWVKKSKLDKIRKNTYESILEVIDTYFKDNLIDMPEKKEDID
jgi:8-oxo-dGTP pyrophosphatase MutT (NUDIX family)